MEKKITVLMALKNAEFGLEFTLNSVIGQKYSNYEFIFALGSSNDQTREKVESLTLDVPRQFLFGQDSGIYSALNAGIRLADPDSWIVILGSGDFFIHPDVFLQVNQAVSDSLDWTIAPWVMATKDFDFIEISGKQEFSIHDVLGSRIPLCHQTVFSHVENLRSIGGFDTRYRVAADRDVIFKLWRKRNPKVLDETMVVYPVGGFSSVQQELGHAELQILWNKHTRGIGKSFFNSLFLKDKRISQSSILLPASVYSWSPINREEMERFLDGSIL